MLLGRAAFRRSTATTAAIVVRRRRRRMMEITGATTPASKPMLGVTLMLLGARRFFFGDRETRQVTGDAVRRRVLWGHVAGTAFARRLKRVTVGLLVQLLANLGLFARFRVGLGRRGERDRAGMAR